MGNGGDTALAGRARKRRLGGQEPSEAERLRAQLSALKVERARLQEALKRADERFLNTIGSCNNWSFEVDARFSFVLCSGASLAILGYAPEELIGRTPFDLMPETVRAVVEPAWRELGMSGRRLDRLEATLLHRDGTPVLLEFNAAPFFTGKRRTAGFQGTIRTIPDPRRIRELEVSEVRYRTLFDSINQGVLFFDTQGQLVAANPAAERAFLREQGVMLGLTCDELTGPCVYADGSPLPPDQMPLARCMREGTPVLASTIGTVRPDGGVAAWFLADAVPIRRSGDLPPFLYLVSFTDITTQVTAQHAIRERESRLRAVFDAALDVSLIVTDLGGGEARIMEFSPGAERMFGYTQEEAVGCPVAMLHLPEDVRRFPEILAAMGSGGSGFSGEATLVRRSGERFTALFTTQPVFDGLGRIVAALGVSMDISHMKKAEAELRESRERLSDAQRLAQLGYWEWDIAADRMILSEQLSRILGGVPVEEGMAYDSFLELVHAEDRDRLQTHVRRAVAREKEFSIDFRVVRADGAERHLHCEADVSFDAAGHAVRMSGMAQDVTERKKSESRLRETARRLRQQARNLEQVNAELQQFIYVMAHDLKAPLRAVSNLSTCLEEDLGPSLGDDHRRKLELLRSRVQRMHGLIQALLNYSRAGRQTQVTTVDCGRLVREVAASLSLPSAFRLEIDPEMPVFITDRLCLAQVLTNLISNAVEHHPRRDGVVRVSAAEDRKHYIFSVADDGRGIPSEYHEKIFEMFQTLEARDKTERTGIGLALVRKLVTGAGGRVTVESTPGYGTTFRVFWPKRLKGSGQFWRSAQATG